MRVTVDRDGNQLKLSNVEFIPLFVRQTSAPCEDAVDTGDVAPEPDNPTFRPKKTSVRLSRRLRLMALRLIQRRRPTRMVLERSQRPRRRNRPRTDTASQRRPNLARRLWCRVVLLAGAALIVTIAFTLAAAAAGTTDWSDTPAGCSDR